MGYKTAVLNPVSGTRLKEELKRKGLTHEKFAEMVDLSPVYIGHMCQGERAISPKRVGEFSKILGVRPEYLLGVDDFRTYSLEWLKKETSLSIKKQYIFEQCLAFWGYSIIENNTIYSYDGEEPEVVDFTLSIQKPTGEIIKDIPSSKIDQLENDILRSVKRYLEEYFNNN